MEDWMGNSLGSSSTLPFPQALLCHFLFSLLSSPDATPSVHGRCCLAGWGGSLLRSWICLPRWGELRAAPYCCTCISHGEGVRKCRKALSPGGAWPLNNDKRDLSCQMRGCCWQVFPFQSRGPCSRTRCHSKCLWSQLGLLSFARKSSFFPPGAIKLVHLLKGFKPLLLLWNKTFLSFQNEMHFKWISQDFLYFDDKSNLSMVFIEKLGKLKIKMQKEMKASYNHC